MMEDRIGEMNTNKQGSLMIIEEYNSATDMKVRFIDSNYLTHTYYTLFKNGHVRNHYDKTVYGVGFHGEGEYTSLEDGKRSHRYDVWKGILQRCYAANSRGRYPTYKDCTVAEQWYNFQNFAKWYDENYYEIDGERMCLDKDILIKGNKIYSPETCIFVPQVINSLFTKGNAKRGNLPIGVKLRKSKSLSYEARSTNGKGGYKYLGCHEYPEKAFNKYKEYRERLIKQVANEYKDRIPTKLYNAMINYIVEITD